VVVDESITDPFSEAVRPVTCRKTFAVLFCTVRALVVVAIELVIANVFGRDPRAVPMRTGKLSALHTNGAPP
jgi:hypothetical protein